MSHKEQIDFCKRVKVLFPESFKGKKVLDCGAYDINGNNGQLFEECDYTGIDLIEGPNVTEISKIHEYRITESNIYDTIISTECFEHDRHFVHSIKRIVELLKPNGLFLFTCATDGRPEHGTVDCLGWASPGTIQQGGGWERYYRNINVSEALDIGQYFRKFSIELDKNVCDLYFWGIK